jgi:hypothetical protein
MLQVILLVIFAASAALDAGKLVIPLSLNGL